MARLKDMTTIPTQAQLHEEVDRVFRDQYPDAPERLDPDDPDQADLVRAWLEIRDEIVNRWTDDVYHEAYPDGPSPIDPQDQSQSPYVDYWLDIRDQIRDDAPAKYDHTAPANAAPVSLLNVTSDPSDLGAILLNFDGAVNPDAIGPWLWPDGIPDGVTVEAAGSATVRLRGLTNRAWMDMDRDVMELIRQEGLVPMEA